MVAVVTEGMVVAVTEEMVAVVTEEMVVAVGVPQKALQEWGEDVQGDGPI